MINETKNKNDSTDKIISNKTISIEKQSQIEINKFSPLQETTTSFSYQPTKKK